VCKLWRTKEWRQRELQLCHATTVSGHDVRARWLLSPESISRHGIWDGIYLVERPAALECPRYGETREAAVGASPRAGAGYDVVGCGPAPVDQRDPGD
jgi:hypothetical protein